MRVVTKEIKDLTDEEYRWCFKANLDGIGRYGSMQPQLEWYKKDPKAAKTDKVKAVMLIDERYEDARALVSWALVFKGTAYFWTKPHKRNKGYGTIVMKEVKNLQKMPYVYPWSDESGGFFSKFKVRTSYYDKSFLTTKPKVC